MKVNVLLCDNVQVVNVVLKLSQSPMRLISNKALLQKFVVNLLQNNWNQKGINRIIHELSLLSMTILWLMC